MPAWPERGSLIWSNGRRPRPGRPKRRFNLLVLAPLALSCLAWGGLAPSSAWAVAPTASTGDVVDLSEDGARLRASVNPGGEATRYWFEYGRTAAYGSFAPASKSGAAGSGSSDLVVSEAVGGLQAGVSYHFRVVASNASGTVEGVDGVFTTRRPAEECPNAAIRREQGSEFLPDCRAYEQVSPVDKLGQRLGGNADGVVDLTLDLSGGRVLYKGLFAVPPAQSPSSGAWGVVRTSAGWQSEGLFPAPGPVQAGIGLPAQDMHLRASAPDQRTIAYWDNTTVPYGSLNVRRADGAIVRIADASLPTLGFAGQSSGQAWGHAFSPDGERLYFSSNQRLGPAVGLAGTADILYEWTDDGGAGDLRVVNRTNDSTVALLSSSAAGLGGATSNATARTNQGPRGLRNAVSDGSDGHDRVFFQTPAPTSETTLTGGPVYMREDGERTVEISAPEGSNLPAAQLRYLDASEDGTRVFFWAGSKLTDDAVEGPGIYRYEVDPGGAGNLVFVASAAPVSGAPPTALVSPDGENLLFSDGSDSTKVSVSGQVSEVIAMTVVGGRVSMTGDGVPHGFSGTVGIRDDRCPTASVTPDGRYFVFIAGGMTSSDIYRYDTVTGEVKVVSAAPAVVLGPQGSSAISTFVNECSPLDGRRDFKSRLVSDDGRRVFFTSAVALSSDDVSVGLDAYEWFDDGTAGGRVSLLTRSASGDHASFLGVDGSGETAFVMSSSRPLAPSDGDAMRDVYAVRVGGGFATGRRFGCAGDSCQGASGERPALASAGSGGADGAGDAASRERPAFSLALSKQQRVRLAAGKPAVLRVRVNRAGAIRVLGRATVAGKRRVVVRASGRARRTGTVLVRLRLSRQARRSVAGGGRLRVVLSTSFAGSEPRRLALRLGSGK